MTLTPCQKTDLIRTALNALRQPIQDAIQADQGDQTEEALAFLLTQFDLLERAPQIEAAARGVLANWESGDLAGAVRELESTLP